MLHLKLDLVACCNFAWREAHNKMLLCPSIALDNLRRTLPPIDEDQRLALLHAPLNYSVWRRTGETPRGEHEACCNLHCVPHANSAPYLLLFSSVCRTRGSFSDRRGRAGPRHPPPALDLASLKKARQL